MGLQLLLLLGRLSLSLYGRSPGPRDFYNTILMLFTPQLRDLKILAAVSKEIGFTISL